MPPVTALSYTYCTRADVEALLSYDGTQGRADDDSSGALSPTEQAYVTRAIAWATADCNLHLLGRYAASELAQSWIVNAWCSVLAAYRLCCRRGNPSAGSIKDMFEQAMEDLKEIKSGMHQLPDTPLRTAAWPTWSNVRVDPLLRLRKARVERALSEDRGGRPDYVQDTDLGAEVLPPPL